MQIRRDLLERQVIHLLHYPADICFQLLK
jgi:hypothetical protein